MVCYWTEMSALNFGINRSSSNILFIYLSINQVLFQTENVHSKIGINNKSNKKEVKTYTRFIIHTFIISIVHELKQKLKKCKSI